VYYNFVKIERSRPAFVRMDFLMSVVASIRAIGKWLPVGAYYVGLHVIISATLPQKKKLINCFILAYEMNNILIL